MNIIETRFENRNGEYVDLKNGTRIFTAPAADAGKDIRSTVSESFKGSHMIIKDIIQIVKPDLPVRYCGISLIIRCDKTRCNIYTGDLISFTDLRKLHQKCKRIGFPYELQEFRPDKYSCIFSAFLRKLEQIVSNRFEEPCATPIQIDFEDPYSLKGQGRSLRSFHFAIEGLLIEP